MTPADHPFDFARAGRQQARQLFAGLIENDLRIPLFGEDVVEAGTRYVGPCDCHLRSCGSGPVVDLPDPRCKKCDGDGEIYESHIGGGARLTVEAALGRDMTDAEFDTWRNAFVARFDELGDDHRDATVGGCIHPRSLPSHRIPLETFA